MPYIINALFVLSFFLPVLSALAIWSRAANNEGAKLPKPGTFILQMTVYPLLFAVVHIGFASWFYAQQSGIVWPLIVILYVIAVIITACTVGYLIASGTEMIEKKK